MRLRVALELPRGTWPAPDRAPTQSNEPFLLRGGQLVEESHGGDFKDPPGAACSSASGGLLVGREAQIGPGARLVDRVAQQIRRGGRWRPPARRPSCADAARPAPRSLPSGSRALHQALARPAGPSASTTLGRERRGLFREGFGHRARTAGLAGRPRRGACASGAPACLPSCSLSARSMLSSSRPASPAKARRGGRRPRGACRPRPASRLAAQRPRSAVGTRGGTAPRPARPRRGPPTGAGAWRRRGHGRAHGGPGRAARPVRAQARRQSRRVDRRHRRRHVDRPRPRPPTTGARRHRPPGPRPPRAPATRPSRPSRRASRAGAHRASASARRPSLAGLPQALPVSLRRRLMTTASSRSPSAPGSSPCARRRVR